MARELTAGDSLKFDGESLWIWGRTGEQKIWVNGWYQTLPIQGWRRQDIREISSVQLKLPNGNSRGFIQFTKHGQKREWEVGKGATHILGENWPFRNDPLTVFFKKDELKEFERFRDAIEKVLGFGEAADKRNREHNMAKAMPLWRDRVLTDEEYRQIEAATELIDFSRLEEIATLRAIGAMDQGEFEAAKREVLADLAVPTRSRTKRRHTQGKTQRADDGPANDEDDFNPDEYCTLAELESLLKSKIITPKQFVKEKRRLEEGLPVSWLAVERDEPKPAKERAAKSKRRTSRPKPK